MVTALRTKQAPNFEEISAKQVMNRVATPYMPFEWSLNPYRGCTHGCSFCYARQTHTYLGLSADDTFQTHIFLKANAADSLRRQLDKLAKTYHYNLDAMAQGMGTLAIGTATDPYQAVEARKELTRDCLKVLAEYRVPVTITTRSPLVLRDVDLFAEMDVRSINLSVNTLNKQVWRRLEPSTPAPLKRLEAVQQLVKQGFHSGILLAPIIPGLTDSTAELEAVVEAAEAHSVQFAFPSVLRLTPDVKAWFMGTLSEHYPELVSRYNFMYRSTYPSSGYTKELMQRVGQLLRRHGLPNRLSTADRRTDTSTIKRAPMGHTTQMVLPL